MNTTPRSSTTAGVSREMLIFMVLAIILALLAGMWWGSRNATPAAEPTLTNPSASGQAPSRGAAESSPEGGPTATGAAPSQAEQRSNAIAGLAKLARRAEGDMAAVGPVDAPVVLIEYSDYRCPFCAKFNRDTVPELKKKYVDSGRLRIEWRDFPAFGEESIKAAQAGRAAGLQGKFWQFHEAIYQNAGSGHPDLPKDKLIDYAREVGVGDLAKFEKDMESAETRKLVERDAQESRSIGANSTPTILVNGEPIVGAQPLDNFVQVIEDQLAKVPAS